MPVNYKLLLKGRNSIFNAKYTFVTNTIIDIKTLMVILVRNNISGVVIINKRFNIGIIIKNNEGAFFKVF